MIGQQFPLKQEKTENSPKISSYELQILQFWKHSHIFQRLRLQAKSNPSFIIYDGPPFPTGDPHFGHICVSVIKDVISRYRFQTGYSVINHLGWDCHGLPIEHEANVLLGIGKISEVHELSIEKYNSVCKQLVIKYSSRWQEVISRYGRWCDFSQTYKTMDMQYMESVWHVFKTLFDRNLIYRQTKIVPYSSYLHTPLSNFQQQLNYKEVDVLSTWITFPISNDQNTKIVVQTCNLWTLPTNLALAVNPNVDYIKIKHQKTGQIYILAQKRLLSFYRNKANQFTRIQNIKGIDLKDVQYIPIFDFLQHMKQYGCFKVLLADFVDELQGSGIRHCSPAFNQLEFQLCLKSKIVNEDNIPICLDQMGRFTKQISKFQGVLFHEIDQIIVSQLNCNQRLLKSQKNRKPIPFCWRTNCPLINRLVNCWSLRVENIKQSIIANNEKIEWSNKKIEQKRFSNWLKDCKDWCISRNRFWGNPIPLWISDDGKQICCVGSKEELERLTRVKIQDLHRNSIDHLTIESKEGRGKLKRIGQVFDCWFESGSMPFAHLHYPFSCNQHQMQELFPADIIVEGIDQVRGWFYTLQVIATALRNTNPIKQIFVNGLILADSFKFDKNRAKDYVDPIDLAQNYGADAVRLYLILSRATIADNVIFSDYSVKDCMNSILVPWLKAFEFLLQCICNFEKRLRTTFELVSNIEDMTQKTIVDNWILSKLQQLITFTFNEMNSHHIHQAVKQVTRFMNELTQWYVELSKDIISGKDRENNGLASLNVFCYCFVQTCIMLNPFTPFLTQHIYQNLRKHIDSKKQSISYLPFPTPIPSLINKEINIAIQQMKYVIESVLSLREKNKIPNTKILKVLKIITNDDENVISNLLMLVDYVKKLARVAHVQFKTGIDAYLSWHCVINMPVFGPKFRGKNVSGLREKIVGLTQKQIQQLRQSEQVQIAGHVINTKTDITIQTKLQRDRIQKYQAIQGNNKIIVIIDTRIQQMTNKQEKDEMT